MTAKVIQSHAGGLSSPSTSDHDNGYFYDLWEFLCECGVSDTLSTCNDSICGPTSEESTVSYGRCSAGKSEGSIQRHSARDMFMDPCCKTIEDKDSLSMATPVSIHPEKVYTEGDATAAWENLLPNDHYSCGSSITSVDSSKMGPGLIQVCFDAQGYRRNLVRETTSRALRQTFSEGDDAVTALSTHKSQKSARFNENLNTTMEYAPPSHHNLRKYHRARSQYGNRDFDYPECQSEGGKARPWTTSLKALDLHRFDCRVIGTSTKDESARPHVLTAAMMDALQENLPFSKRGERFWLKYSLVRDGSSMQTLLHQARGADYTVLAVETMDGEIFGAFTSRPWHVTFKYYGTPESFLWRLTEPRAASGASTRSDAELLESELEVFPFSGHNDMVQICSTNRLAVGGGTPDDLESLSLDRRRRLAQLQLRDWGFGLAFGTDLQEGTSSPCVTFESPSLSKFHSDGSVFEVLNLEIWTLTPCTNIQDAERLSEGLQVLERCPTI